MFEHILLPVDGSSTSRQAIVKALLIAEKFKSTVTLIYVIDPYAFTGVGTDFSYGQSEYLSAATAEAQQAIGTATRIFEEHGIPVKGSVVEGHTVYSSILDTAEAVNADLIIMGSHGRRGLEKLVLGSVTAQVLSHAHLSVLVVRS
jgi:nucleotide-binding universal stress UspA family protein